MYDGMHLDFWFDMMEAFSKPAPEPKKDNVIMLSDRRKAKEKLCNDVVRFEPIDDLEV